MSNPQINAEQESMLEKAQRIVKQRQGTYGSPVTNFTVIAQILTVLGFRRIHTRNSQQNVQTIFAEDIAIMMIAVKLAREYESHHPDNPLDIAGYAACLAQVNGE